MPSIFSASLTQAQPVRTGALRFCSHQNALEFLLKIHLFWQHSQKLDFRGSGGEGKTRPGDSDDHGCLEVAPLPPAQGRDQISGLVHNRYLFICCNTFLMLRGMNRRIRQERARLKCAHPLPLLCPGWPAVNSCQPTTGRSGWTGQP